MEILSQNLSQIRVPTDFDNIYNEECVYSYDTPESENGLYVSLSSFLGFGKDYVEGYYKKTGNAVFLHIHRTKTEIVEQKEESEEGPEKKITRLAIGIEGGYQGNNKKYEYHDTHNIVLFPNHVSIPYPSEGLPEQVDNSVKKVIAAESALKKLEKEQLAGTWDGEVRQVSIYAPELMQLDNGVKIPPTGWKCSKCDLTNNLWLNLTDGSILCGRKFFDGTGGNDHAVQHFKETTYPLAVKLGTITADGKADVYSYAEDDMVEDPYLKKHLSHFGINIGQLEKTEKSMIEMELELNQKVGEWSILQESSSALQPVAGPGLTGMTNLGNSCYMNSVMQVIFTVPDFIKRFVDKANDIFATYPADPVNDFNVQMAKLGYGLCSGKYSSISEDSLDTGASGISPAMFKNLIGRGHIEFSSKQQQDAQEYLLHLINMLDKNSRNQDNPADALKFRIEDRVECGSSGKVKYTYRDEWCLPLQIPLSAAINLDEVRKYEAEKERFEQGGKQMPDNVVRPKIPLRACFDKLAENELVDQYYSTAISGKTFANKRTRMASMPDYLMLHLKKFTVRQDWAPMKLDVSVDCPDVLDLEFLRGTGLLPNEQELPELQGPAPTPPPMDPNVLQQLNEMGFSIDACKRAVFFTKNTGLETATNWIMEHIGDDDLQSPFVVPGTDTSKTPAFVPDPVGLETLMCMGFNQQQATKALKETDNNAERAVDYIFSHQDELDDLQMEMETDSAPPQQQQQQQQQRNVRDGDSKYKLRAFISHMGTSAQVGHYVCHILKDDQWIIFNDNKVAISQNPPKDLGYLYLYERIKN